MICDWEEFKADTEKPFMKRLADFMRKNSEMVKTINYTGIGPFIPYLRRTLLESLELYWLHKCFISPVLLQSSRG